MKLKNKRWLSITVGSLVTLCIITLAIGLHPSNMKEHPSQILYTRSLSNKHLLKKAL